MRFAIVTKQYVDNSALLLALSHIPNASVVVKATELDEVGQLCKDGEVDIILADASVVARSSKRVSADVATADTIEPSRQLQVNELADLSPREREVLSLLGEGLSNRRISRLLGVTERTTKAHVGSILSKLGVESRLQAGLLARAYLGILGTQPGNSVP